jgi:hypothetical protein
MRNFEAILKVRLQIVARTSAMKTDDKTDSKSGPQKPFPHPRNSRPRTSQRDYILGIGGQGGPGIEGHRPEIS